MPGDAQPKTSQRAVSTILRQLRTVGRVGQSEEFLIARLKNAVLFAMAMAFLRCWVLMSAPLLYGVESFSGVRIRAGLGKVFSISIVTSYDIRITKMLCCEYAHSSGKLGC